MLASHQAEPARQDVGPTETVTRPDPGLARGKWEAPAWALWVILAAVLAATTLFVLRRMGILRLPGTKR
ncbi:MAG: hypothetical protein KF819_07805 [Labilithrix sp.]|nr:hypothetical protein [Labilithrix sp.]